MKKKAEEKTTTGFKGFDKNFKCRDHQYEIGKTYVHEGKVKACESGFHACEHPLNVFSYYAPASSNFAKVEMSGEISKEENGDSKVSCAKITIGAQLQISDLVAEAVAYVFGKAKWLKTKSATGTRGAASATGYQGAASATGYQGAASATGDQGAASATGYQGAASATGTRGAASATGYQGAASGKNGNALFLVERDFERNIIAAWAGIVGKDGIEEDIVYCLHNGKVKLWSDCYQ